MDDTKADLILSRLDDTREHISKRIDELRDRVDAQNSRIGKLEATDAVLIERVETIQQRGCAVGARLHGEPPGKANEPEASWWKPSKPLTQGGVGAGIVVTVIEVVKAALAALRGGG
jgi:CRP-like cAMP-binding protein